MSLFGRHVDLAALARSFNVATSKVAGRAMPTTKRKSAVTRKHCRCHSACSKPRGSARTQGGTKLARGSLSRSAGCCRSSSPARTPSPVRVFDKQTWPDAPSAAAGRPATWCGFHMEVMLPLLLLGTCASVTYCVPHENMAELLAGSRLWLSRVAGVDPAILRPKCSLVLT